MSNSASSSASRRACRRITARTRSAASLARLQFLQDGRRGARRPRLDEGTLELDGVRPPGPAVQGQTPQVIRAMSQWAVQPPSIESDAPVTMDADGEQS